MKKAKENKQVVFVTEELAKGRSHKAIEKDLEDQGVSAADILYAFWKADPSSIKGIGGLDQSVKPSQRHMQKLNKQAEVLESRLQSALRTTITFCENNKDLYQAELQESFLPAHELLGNKKEEVSPLRRLSRACSKLQLLGGGMGSWGDVSGDPNTDALWTLWNEAKTLCEVNYS